ncbi:hypothetical protein D3C78_1348830 [compost metagenome]
MAGDQAGEYLVEAEPQGRAERQQHRRGEQLTARMHDHQHTDETQHHGQPLPEADLFLQQGHRERRHQHRCQEVHRGGFSKGDELQAGGEQQAGTEQAQCAEQLKQRPLGPQHAQARAGQEDAGHQQGMHQVAGPDHHHYRVEAAKEFGEGVVPGEEEGGQHHQQDAPQRLVGSGQRGTDAHGALEKKNAAQPAA